MVSRSDNDSAILLTETHADGRGAFTGIHMKIYDFGKKTDH
ncbi:MAG: hypothetical protein HC887_04325 [Desulfobacteraceae bacterium]|nr:hypothetical protein [Desulfobacteraceae bacterium]